MTEPKPKKTSIVDRRKHPRVQTPFDVLYAVLDNEGRKTVRGTAVDISEGGIRFETDRFLPVGDEVEMEIRLTGVSAPIQAVARVQRVERLPTGFSVAFRFVTDSCRETLGRILERQFLPPDPDAG